MFFLVRGRLLFDCLVLKIAEIVQREMERNIGDHQEEEEIDGDVLLIDE